MGSVSIKKRGKYYQYTFDVAKIDGKRKQKSKSGFKTKAEAQKEGTKAYNEYLSTGIEFEEKNISYNDYLDYWLKNYCEVNLKYNTYSKYEMLIKKYIKPYLGHFRLASITSAKLTTYINKICSEYDFSRDYFNSILKVVKGSFRDANNVYNFINNNPAITIRLPKLLKHNDDPKHLYNNEEIELIVERFKNDDTFICAFLTACYTGMRTGELFALTWDDIDFENKTITINKNVYAKPKDHSGRWFIGTTKTETGNRTIYISDTLYKILIKYKNKQDLRKKVLGKNYIYYHLEKAKNGIGKETEFRIVKNNINEKYKNLNLVFTKNNGKYSGKDIIKYPFKVIRDELGLKCRFYDLRGSYATNILNSGAEIRNVADLLGHKNIETTENFYISSTSESRRLANATLDKTLKLNVVDTIFS